MALYDNLPVYKAAYDMFQDITILRSKMKREYKFTLGERLMNASLDLIINIYKANRQKEKKKYIEVAQEQTELIRLLLRLLKDIKEISLKRFISLNEKIEMVSKQLTGWMKYQKK
jgi:four helix bundle protein|tara:strand:- start:114 stop:458 length:345 start_codon:yes stop_codon:yes gene_type:complete